MLIEHCDHSAVDDTNRHITRGGNGVWGDSPVDSTMALLGDQQAITLQGREERRVVLAVKHAINGAFIKDVSRPMERDRDRRNE